MSRSATPRLGFDSAAASASLKSAFQAELEAVHRGGPGQVYKPAQPAGTGTGGAWAHAGGWAQPKPATGLMADGKDFVATLAASLAKSKAGSSTSTKK